MSTQTAKFATDRNDAAIQAWPHHGQPISLSEAEVRNKVAITLVSELDVPAERLSDDAPLRQEFDLDVHALGGPIMTIENYFRTLLQDEIAKSDVSVGSIVDRLMGRTEGNSTCESSICACAA